MTTANLPTDDVTAIDIASIDTAALDTGPTCDACQHPLDAHDALGLRFCAATLSAALPRGCICR